jgi:hypothetical protein
MSQGVTESGSGCRMEMLTALVLVGRLPARRRSLQAGAVGPIGLRTDFLQQLTVIQLSVKAILLE